MRLQAAEDTGIVIARVQSLNIKLIGTLVEMHVT